MYVSLLSKAGQIPLLGVSPPSDDSGIQTLSIRWVCHLRTLLLQEREWIIWETLVLQMGSIPLIRIPLMKSAHLFPT